jgi:ElaB/YqjD/DUF883 family membrane-anchored ribosome-binding protein
MAANEGRQGGTGMPGEQAGSGMGEAGARGEGIGSGVGTGFSGAAAGSGAADAGFGGATRGTPPQGGDEGGAFAERAKGQAHELADRTRDKAHELADEGRDRALDAAEQGRSRLADGMSRLSEGIDDRARSVEEHGGMPARAGDVMHRASDALDSGADYLRTHDLPMIRDDVIEQIRERPLFACGIALGAGFLLGSMGGGDDERARDRHDEERWERYVSRLERSGRLKGRMRDEAEDDRHGVDRHDRGGRFAALRSSWDDDDYDDDDDGHDDASGIRAQLGRALVAGVGALLSRQIQSRIAGRDE